MSLSEILPWLIAGGSVTALAWLLEAVPAWANWVSPWKRPAFYLLSAMFAVGAWALQTYAPETIAALEPVFTILAGIFATVFLGQVAHKFSPTRK